MKTTINASDSKDSQNGDRLITKAEAASMLSVSTRTIDRICQRNLLQKVYVGGGVRFRLRDILAIIEFGI